MKATKAPLSAALLLVFALFTLPSAFAEDPGWHYGRVVGIHTNGLVPLRIRLDPSTREKCGGESDYVGVNHPGLAGHNRPLPTMEAVTAVALLAAATTMAAVTMAVRSSATTAAQLLSVSATRCPSRWLEAHATMAACTVSLGQFG